MDGIVNIVLIGVTSFIATNLDDLAILMLFFAQANGTFRSHQIVAGQYLGFCTLLLASIPGYFGGLMLSKPWIGLLGLLPIWIGCTSLLKKETDEDKTDIQTVSSPPKIAWFSGLTGLLSPQSYQVAAVTIANGGDNIGIYVPLFASSNGPQFWVTLVIFLGMVGVWCWCAAQLAQHPAIAPILSRYGDRFIPWILIGLGIYILIENRSVQLLSQSVGSKRDGLWMLLSFFKRVRKQADALNWLQDKIPADVLQEFMQKWS